MKSVSNKPLVTVIAVCFNHEKYVVETLCSIAGQDYDNYELIVVDDCSTDNSVREIIRWNEHNKLADRLLFHDVNAGICASVNEAVDIAKGIYVQIISCDDVLLRDKLSTQVGLLEKNRCASLCWSNFRIINKHGEVINRKYYPDNYTPPEDSFIAIINKKKMSHLVLHAPTLLLRKSMMDEVGKYPEAYLQEDFFMTVTCAFKYDTVFSNNVLVEYRRLKSSLARSMTSAKNREKVLRDKLEVLQSFKGRVSGEREKALLVAILDRLSGLELLYRKRPSEISRDENIQQIQNDREAIIDQYQHSKKHMELIDEKLSELPYSLWLKGIVIDKELRKLSKNLPLYKKMFVLSGIPKQKLERMFFFVLWIKPFILKIARPIGT